MRIYLLLLFIVGFLFQSQAQTTDTTIYRSIMTMPEFPGGDTAFIAFVKENLVYPEDAKRKGIQGIVYLKFMVEADGSLSSIQVPKGKGLSPSCDQAAIDMLLKSPRWKPATQNGFPHKISMIQPIRFVLSKRTGKK